MVYSFNCVAAKVDNKEVRPALKTQLGYSCVGFSGVGYPCVGYSGVGYSGVGYSGISGYSGIQGIQVGNCYEWLYIEAC